VPHGWSIHGPLGFDRDIVDDSPELLGSDTTHGRSLPRLP